MKSVSDLFGDNWPIRRRVMFLTLIWMGGQVTWMLVRGTDDALHQQAIIALIAGMMSIVCAYVFGAVWDDHNKRMRLRIQPDADEGSDDHGECHDDTPPNSCQAEAPEETH